MSQRRKKRERALRVNMNVLVLDIRNIPVISEGKFLGWFGGPGKGHRLVSCRARDIGIPHIKLVGPNESIIKGHECWWGPDTESTRRRLQLLLRAYLSA